ncbi:hypothetical protein [Halomonas sp. H5]|uniref:hypothetical protein n=1 Tax=Halomonas sp. H5 TaxID=3423910 RepID=UPI003D369FB7
MSSDQAQGLRRWAEVQGASEAATSSRDDRETAIAKALIEIALEEKALVPASPAPKPPADESSAPRARGEASPVEAARTGRAAMARSPRPTPSRHLRVLGLSADELPRARGLLAAWAARGWGWVGAPDDWHLESVTPASIAGHPAGGHWALWVAPGPEAFRRGYRLLMALSRVPGPRRLLLLSPGARSRRGLPDNLARVAAGLGIELLVIAP